jgi:hypothetical protein
MIFAKAKVPLGLDPSILGIFISALVYFIVENFSKNGKKYA